MKFTKTNIEGLVIIEPRVFGDERGYFLETYNEKEFKPTQDDLQSWVGFVYLITDTANSKKYIGKRWPAC